MFDLLEPMATCFASSCRKHRQEVFGSVWWFVNCAFFIHRFIIFTAIGCAGEIHIHEHEDYDKWAIDILVKFRDDEKLQLLTSQRQSGGVRTQPMGFFIIKLTYVKERSLTTILYLMSLTEEARAPFSLVDEINQVCILHFFSVVS